MTAEAREPSAYALEVLAVVRRIPRGKVLSYGDVRDALGGGSARAVGQVMFRWGHRLAWHRVVMADGSPKSFGGDEQLARLVDDGTPMSPDGRKVDMERARWRPRT